MKNLVVANHQPQARVTLSELTALLDAQIENSLTLGWTPGDLIVVANFPYECGGVRAEVSTLNGRCLRGSKMFALDRLFRTARIMPGEIVWAHDLDAWQNHWFAAPDIQDIGLAEYSRPKFNGGSVFVRSNAGDIVNSVVREIVASDQYREEPTINRVLRSAQYRDRVTVLNSTYNLGCSGFCERFLRSTKPILVSHFHPTNKIAWDTHVNDRNQLGPSLAPRLVELLTRRFYGGIPPAKLSRTRKAKVSR